MKKVFFLSLILCFIIPINGTSQDITTHIDDFTGEKVVTTSWEKIYQGGATGMYQTRMCLRHEGGKNYIEFRIFTDDVVSCNEGNKILFKTTKGIISVSNTRYTLAKPGDWHSSAINRKLGIYLICSGNLEKIKDATVQKIRITLNDGYVDLDLKEKESNKIIQLYNKFTTCINQP